MDNKSAYFTAKGILASPGFQPKMYFLAAAVCLGLVVGFSSRLQRDFGLEKQKILYTPPPEALRLFSGSFRSFLADMFYIRGILGITDEFNDPARKISWVQDNFAAALSLDSRLVQGYFFAAIVLGRDKESIAKGIAFLEEHRGLNNSEWRIPYWLGFNYYQLGDYLQAARYYQEASGLPGAPEFLKSNPAVFYYRAGKAELGVKYLRGLLNSLKEKRQAKWLKLKLTWLENIVILEKKVEEFQSRFGHLPENLEELTARGLIPELPQDFFGQGYYLDRESGRVKSRFGQTVNHSYPDSSCSGCAGADPRRQGDADSIIH